MPRVFDYYKTVFSYESALVAQRLWGGPVVFTARAELAKNNIRRARMLRFTIGMQCQYGSY